MGFSLGVDLGTTWTAAAVARDGQATVATLGRRSPAIPSVVYVAPDGSVLVGDAAVRRAIDEPDRIAREVKRRIGDGAPVLLGGTPWTAEHLQARVLRWVADTVAAEQGEWPSSITVTHPANWGPYKLDLLRRAAGEVGLVGIWLQPEPVAAAAWYATEHRMGVGEVVAVYDLGGGTFDVAVVRRESEGFTLLGSPGGVERLGGVDFDAAVLAHVGRQVQASWSADEVDPSELAELAELRDRCVEAKEALSFDSVASIPVTLGGQRTTVRLTRDEFEAMVRGSIGATVVATRSTLASAGVAPTDLRAVLLVGGSSRIPLVAQVVGAELGVGVAVDANPKYAVALGASLHVPRTQRAPDAGSPPVALAGAEPPGRRGRLAVLAGVGVFAIVILAAALMLLGGGGDDGDGDGDGERSADAFERTESDDTTTTSTATEPTTTAATATTAAPSGGRRGEPEAPPALSDPEQAAFAQACFEGTMAACDELFFASDVDSPGEAYAESCGGRTDEPVFGSCLEDMPPSQALPPPGPIPATSGPEEAANAQACFDGDLVACDDLYLFSDIGTAAEEYGATCGGRRDDSRSGECAEAFDGPG